MKTITAFLALVIFISGCSSTNCSLSFDSQAIKPIVAPTTPPQPSPPPTPPPTPPPPAPTTGNLTGHIKSGKMPCGGILVTITGVDYAETVSAPDGSYSFADLPLGDYTAYVSSPFSRYVAPQDTTITADGSIVNFELIPITLNRCLGGNNYDYGKSICIDNNGNIWITGYTNSASGSLDVPGTSNPGSSNDLWLLGINPTKEDPNEQIIYNRCFGGSAADIGNGVCVSPDGTTVWVVGQINSNDATDMPNKKHGGIDIWLLGIDPTDDTLPPKYNRCFGGSNTDIGHSICTSPDGNIVWIAGQTLSAAVGNSDTKSLYGSNDLWLLGIDPSIGDATAVNPIIYNRCFGGNNDDYGYGVCADTNGTVWVTGYTNSAPSTDNDIPNTKYSGGNSDLWLLGVNGNDDTEDPIYNRCFGGISSDIGRSLCIDANGIIWLTGETKSLATSDNDIPKHYGTTGTNDLWLLGINPKAEYTDTIDKQIIYNRCFGGTNDDIGQSVCIAADGTIWVTGQTNSTTTSDNDIPDIKYADYDLWILGIDPTDDTLATLYNNCFGGADKDYGRSICVSPIGTVWVTGETNSAVAFDNDIPNRHGTLYDLWLMGVNGTL